MKQIISRSEQETEKIGENIAKHLRGNEIIALFGDMGMGKTAFTRGLSKHFGVNSQVSSPTFSIVNEYNGRNNIYHFDMYRVNTWDDLYSTGFFEYIDKGIIVIEWSENIVNALPENIIKIEIKRGSNENERLFNIKGFDEF